MGYKYKANSWSQKPGPFTVALILLLIVRNVISTDFIKCVGLRQGQPLCCGRFEDRKLNITTEQLQKFASEQFM
jgi:hypothetical protein